VTFLGRSTRVFGCATLVALPLLSGSAAAAPSGVVPDGVVYGAGAAGAVLGLTLRIPAVSAGGIGYADTQINLDSSRARSSAAYPGFLVDAFMKSSCGCAYDPTDTTAQNPPSSSAPTRATFQGNQSTPAGEAATLVADTPSVVDASSRYVSGSLAAPGAPISVRGGTVTSSSAVRPDGTVVTEVTTTATGIEIAGLVTVSAATSTAKTVTAPGRQPLMSVTTSVGSVLVAGLRSELSERGLVIADTSAVTPQQIATFNAALSTLAAQGVYVSALEPVVETVRPGFGEVLTGALRVRYQVKDNPTPNDIGTDVEYLVASVGNLASSQPRVRPRAGEGLELPSISTPPLPGPQNGTGSAGLQPLSGGTNSGSLTAAGTAAAAPLVAPDASGSASSGASSGMTLTDLLANSKKAGAAPKVIGLYGWLVALALVLPLASATILGRRPTA
jgi:hypothetical protein